jgi:hypothetical protein
MSTPRKGRKMRERVGLLFDFASSQPEGFDKRDAAEALGIDIAAVPDVIHNLRLELASGDINLVAEPNGRGNLWTYRLVGSTEDARIWQTNRIGDMESRLAIQQAVAHSMSVGTDSRTREGKKARLIDKALTRLLEDLTLLQDDMV